MNERLELFTSEHMGLTWDFQVNPETCGNNTHYENYIRFSALSDKRYGLGTTHVLVGEENGNKILLGFMTLRSSSYIVQQDDSMHGEPALEIMELAIDRRYEHLGYGRRLVNAAIDLADSLTESSISFKYIVLCADRQAVPFYSRCDFAKLSDYAEVPRNGANDECIPMAIRIRE